MGRTPCCDRNGLKKGPWTPEEDQKLIDYIQKHGYGNWRTLPKNAGLQRCGKSCRLRWTNYLRPDIKRGRFSFEEEETIIQLHSILGNKWSAIAARLPGRTDNEIKNYWNTHIRKRLLRMGIDPITHSPRLDLLDLSSIFNHHTANFFSNINNHQHLLMNNFNFNNMLGLHQHTAAAPLVNPEILKLATSLFPTTTTTQPPIDNNIPIASIPPSMPSSSSSNSQSNEIQPISNNGFNSQQQTTLHQPNHLLIMSSSSSDWDEPFNTHFSATSSDLDSTNDQYNYLTTTNSATDHSYYIDDDIDTTTNVNVNHGGIYDSSTLHQGQYHPVDNIIYNNNPVASDFGFISTSSPSTTPLNSSNSTYINGGSTTITQEDIERESYSSSSNNNLVNFPPHILQHLNNHFIL